MLPNWLLGKSKSKLQEILGGGGGTAYTAGDGIDISSGVISFDPSTMDAIPQSKVTNLDDDLADLAPKTAITNPNLLDNPWFTVNQRGENSYNETSEKYFIDRWRAYTSDSNSAISISDNGITFDSGAIMTLYQRINKELYPSLRNKTLTLSVLLSDGSIKTDTFVFPSTDPSSTSSIHVAQISGQWYMRLVYISGVEHAWRAEVFTWGVAASTSLSIRAVKLELGSVSTLAMDTAPNYATELLKCQQYFITLDTAVSLSSYTSYSNMYTAPSDGYIQFESAASGSATRTIYTYGNNTTAATDPHVKHSTSANSKSYEIFIKKGLKVYIDGLQTGDTFEFYPLS